jgi:F0F1-type ATP synthase membrane subunit b/b'
MNMQPDGAIVVGVAESVFNGWALRWAAEQARLEGRALTLANAAGPVAGTWSEHGMDALPHSSEMLREHGEALLARAREERAQMLKEARETKDKIINEAKDQAKTEAGKIITDARAAIETQKMAAITELKNQMGNLVIEVSEKILRRQLENKSEQESYIRQLAEEVKLN